MHLDAKTLPPLAAPDPLAVLHHLASATSDEIALLHSATNSSHSVLAFDPLVTLEFDAAATAHLQSCLDEPNENQKSKIKNEKSPLAALEQTINAFSFDAPHPLVGWLGFISYDIARILESPLIPALAPDELRWPLLRWTLFRHYLLHDPQTQQWTPISIAADPAIPRDLLLAVNEPPPLSEPSPRKTLREVPPIAFRANVDRVKTYIAAGDIYQANIAQRWEIPTSDPPHEIYRRLCHASPAPYAGFFRFEAADGIAREILSASPELFITLDNAGGRGQLVTRPIKGTRRRDLADPTHDEQLRDDLMASEKDKSELTMIVDLLRNDLGRVSEFGSVQVHEPRALEQHPTVWHTVATIASTLRPNAGLADLLAAVCPGGSVTGAPKIRAMQIIEELEGPLVGRRALYCGNIGVIGPMAQSLTLNIAIRTILMQAGHAHVYAGGGIVADSDPQLEYEESLHKAAALLRALGAGNAT